MQQDEKLSSEIRKQGVAAFRQVVDWLAQAPEFRHTSYMDQLSDTPLGYQTPVILVGAAPVSGDGGLATLPKEWPLIAADGGANLLAALGRSPDLIMGDLDSVDHLPADARVMRLAGQDDTDFEKCLNRISAPLIIGIGFLDGRFDHSLACLHALTALTHDRPVMLLGEHDVMVRLRGNFHLRSDAGEALSGTRFSVWPLGCQTFRRSRGLQWPLDGLTMRSGELVGTSNAISTAPVEIEAGDGDGYAVIMPRSQVDVLLAAILSASS